MASNSPRRREMLSWAGWSLEKVPSQVDEMVLENETPRDYVVRIAVDKSTQADIHAPDEDFVIAADTIVVRDGEILGKPDGEQDAFRILSALRGAAHQVLTALAVRKCSQTKPLVEICVSNVYMRQYSDAEIWKYIESGDPLDKAGAYAIQDADFRPVLDFKGCFASVMGLPLCHMERTLRGYPEYSKTDWGMICQKNLEYTCPITRRVMAGEDIG